MESVKSLLFLAGLCVLLCGCMGVKQREYRRAHFGPYPTNYHDLVTEWVANNFDSPRSVYISNPVRARFPNSRSANTANRYGWCAGVSFESQGIFDTYTPRKHYHVYIRDGNIVTTQYNTLEQPRTRGFAQSPHFR